MIERFYEHNRLLTAALSNAISEDLSQQLVATHKASIAVSGGNTPKALYEQLSTVALDWPKISVTLTDERWVDTNHPDSNEGMVRRHLLKHNAVSASFLSLKTRHTTAKEGALVLSKMLKDQLPSVDFVLLGMGSDGHFASLFPHTESLVKGLDKGDLTRCIDTFAPVEPKQRISLTLSMLLTAKKIYLLITGDDKLSVYRRACLNDQINHTSTLPIAAVLNQTEVPVEVFWSPSES
ncbi:6-phosphogluconolactonase [Alkalimarinus alittae]|uniref:6-phosphogluconolactonase n=1 Tax=Alkalimarinus alittae TaxID=2961619 RepID=A0ABY6MXK1_9ALTE|nr:6-phosphogluconolactonase [Alkalimarinus alittae]UZE94557.1 6-phosphogluconolactonase [Alkalimarinus alittae]